MVYSCILAASQEDLLRTITSNSFQLGFMGVLLWFVGFSIHFFSDLWSDPDPIYLVNALKPVDVAMTRAHGLIGVRRSLRFQFGVLRTAHNETKTTVRPTILCPGDWTSANILW
jgi:hypothetical protein